MNCCEFLWSYWNFFDFFWLWRTFWTFHDCFRNFHTESAKFEKIWKKYEKCEKVYKNLKNCSRVENNAIFVVPFSQYKYLLDPVLNSLTKLSYTKNVGIGILNTRRLATLASAIPSNRFAFGQWWIKAQQTERRGLPALQLHFASNHNQSSSPIHAWAKKNLAK